MKKQRCLAYALPLALVTVGASLGIHAARIQAAETTAPSGKSPWAGLDSHGKLTYRSLQRGDHILDFSFAGYGGGGVSLPDAPVKRTVHPSGGDDTAAIQAAIDAVSALEPQNGIRGAVLLAPGTYTTTGALTIRTGGVVLRGSGSAANGTTINMTGKPHVCVSVTGEGAGKETGGAVAITDTYVPSGANSLQVADASRFAVGDTVVIHRPITDAWVHFMGMDTLVRNGKPQKWLSGETRTERTIKSISGNRLTFDMPLTDSFDAHYLNPPGGTVVKRAPSGRITQVGVEKLHIVSPAQAIGIDQPQHKAIQMNNIRDAWVQDVAIDDTINSVSFGAESERITVDHVAIRHSVATQGAAKPADFTAGGTQILFNRCTVRGDNLFYFVTGARVTGPNVLLNCTFQGNGHVQPHARWATGLLVDNCQTPEGGIDFMNRGIFGSGHGWTVGWAVAWNCSARSFVIQQPPGAANWAIGCKGERVPTAMPGGNGSKIPEGIFDSPGTPVAPASLYLAQLRERLGSQALKNIGY